MLKKHLYFFILLVSIWACNDPKDVEPILLKNASSKLDSFNLLVVNEGNFGSGVGTITKVNWNTNEPMQAEQNAFYNQNKEYLGNVVQSISLVGDELWVIVNNSQKIIRCDKKLKKVGEITGFNSPRYLAFNSKYVFVSDLYDGNISVIDRSDFKIKKHIKTETWTEELLILGDELWVTETSGRSVLVIDANKLTVKSIIKVAREPFAIKKLNDNTVKVLCNGGLMEQEKPYLYTINMQTKTKTDSVDLSSLKAIPNRLVVYDNETYFLANDLYKISGNSYQKVIDGAKYNFYNFEVDDSYFYLTDVKDYVREGDLHRYFKNNFAIHDSVKVGVIPGFIFKE